MSEKSQTQQEHDCEREGCLQSAVGEFCPYYLRLLHDIPFPLEEPPTIPSRRRA